LDDPAYKHQRRPETLSDRQITVEGRNWLLALDQEFFPRELAKSCPRIVNRRA